MPTYIRLLRLLMAILLLAHSVLLSYTSTRHQMTEKDLQLEFGAPNKAHYLNERKRTRQHQHHHRTSNGDLTTL